MFLFSVEKSAPPVLNRDIYLKACWREVRSSSKCTPLPAEKAAYAPETLCKIIVGRWTFARNVLQQLQTLILGNTISLQAKFYGASLGQSFVSSSIYSLESQNSKKFSKNILQVAQCYVRDV